MKRVKIDAVPSRATNGMNLQQEPHVTLPLNSDATATIDERDVIATLIRRLKLYKS